MAKDYTREIGMRHAPDRLAAVWTTSLETDGFARFPGMMPAALVAEALEAIGRDRREHEVAERQVEYDSRSYCPDLLGTPPIMDLLQRSPVRGLIDDARP